MYKLQSQINVCVDLNQIYEKKPDIVIIENLNLNINQQFKRCEEIRELLNEGYDVYTSLNISFFENRVSPDLKEVESFDSSLPVTSVNMVYKDHAGTIW